MSLIKTDTLLTAIATEVAKTITERLTAAGIQCVVAHVSSVVELHKVVRTFHVHEVREQQTLEQDPKAFAAMWGANLTAEILSTLKQAHEAGVIFYDLPRPIALSGTFAFGTYDNVKVLAVVEYRLPEYLYSLGVEFSTSHT
jgi:hypothetical protein